jgi:hypothetical protein
MRRMFSTILAIVTGILVALLAALFSLLENMTY